MRLTSIELENFRCFEKEKIELHPQLNVFVGVNASGKTALLEGIAIGIGEFVTELGFGDLVGPKMDWSDGRIEGMRRVGPVHVYCTAEFGRDKETATWATTSVAFHNSRMDVEELQQQVAKTLEERLWTNETHFPILLYFSTQRIWDREKFIEPDLSKNRIARMSPLGYIHGLDRVTNTSYFQSEIEKEQKAAQQSKELGYPYDSSRLNLIRSIAAKVIDDCEIFYLDYEKESLAVMFKGGRRLTLEQLSDGQKSLLLISTGIAFQCATLNPHMGLDAYKSNGVVLIDEVELHLHPDWQRQILPILTREFPNIQFICTTHSPQVLSTLNRENVQVIENFHVHPVDHYVRGRDSNAILSEVFGIGKRPKEFAEQLQHFYALLEDNEYEKAKLVLEALEEIWGSMDSEIVRGWLFWADGQEVVLDDAEEVA